MLGEISKYKVLRETDLGYILFSNNEEFFLHHNECKGQVLFEGDYVEAFLYADKKNRLAATLYKPFITIHTIGFVLVVDVKEDLGVFLNIGISKDVLLSKDDLPVNMKEWPQVGDRIIATLRTKNNKLIAKVANKYEIIENNVDKVKLDLNSKVEAYVYRITDECINAVTESMNVIFIHHSNIRKSYRLGEKIEPKIIQENETDYNGTLIEHKEFQIKDDKLVLLKYLRENNGVMMITEDSSPELISRIFGMSKSAFKKAIGNLYKDRIISIEEDKVILLED